MATKKTTIDLVSNISSILNKDAYLFDSSADSGDSIYSEIPVDIETFVTSKDWLGIEPQRHPDDPSIIAPSPLSAEQKEFIEVMTDFENKTSNAILWVGEQNLCLPN